MQPDDFRSSYDAVAEVYAKTFFDELSRKPFDRELLGTVSRSEFMGEPAPFEATLFEKDELAGLVRASGFQVTLSTIRPPYQFEYQTPRLYIGATAL